MQLNPEALGQVVGLLRRVPLFDGLPDSELAWIAARLYQHAFRPGAIITREGETSRVFSILLEGQIAVYKSLGMPEERLLTIMQAGDFFGEMSMYDDEDDVALNQRTATLVARNLVLVLELPAESLKELLNRQPGVAYRVMQVMAVRVRELESATIRDLREKNRRLSQALHDLQRAQAQLVEKEKLEHELIMARSIQERILPKELPELPGWTVQARWQPARAVSGDFYDFLTLPDGRLGLVIGDVSGKGVPASLVMATTSSVLRATARALTGRRRNPGRRRTGMSGVFANPFRPTQSASHPAVPRLPLTGPGAPSANPPAPDAGSPTFGATGVFFPPLKGPAQGDASGSAAKEAPGKTTRTFLPAPLAPGQLLAQVNDLLGGDMPPGMFAACLFGLLDPATGAFRFANAGHTLPLLLRPIDQPPGYRVIELRATGMPLGLLPDRDYVEQSATLIPGDRLLLYSDGLVEAHNPEGQMFGVPRLRQELEMVPSAGGDLIDHLLDCLCAFTGPAWEQEDDVTLVTVGWSEQLG